MRVLIWLCLIVLMPLSVHAQRDSQPTAVTAHEVTRKAFVDRVEALGTLRANESVMLSATVTERVVSVNFEDGQRVKRGDVLVKMDAGEEMALMAEARATMVEAEQQLERSKALQRDRVVSESVLDERERNYLNAKARLAAIESRIAERRITAPFDGVVGLRNISVGALVEPGSEITTIDDDSVMKLDFSVPAVFLASLKAGVTIQSNARAFEGRIFEGTVASVDSRIDPVTRSILVRAIIDNPDELLKPGLLMRVRLSKNPRDAIVVPEEALQINGSQHSVFVVTEKEAGLVAEQRNVQIGARRKGEAEILEGLKVGEQVVTHGIVKLRPGSKVRLKDDPLASSKAAEE